MHVLLFSFAHGGTDPTGGYFKWTGECGKVTELWFVVESSGGPGIGSFDTMARSLDLVLISREK